ncbi:protein FAM81A [Lingula anatina]|uniref:Protein FAM81A n=1 Tax=Lingula anatina TaxID=7574 RepID=A0A1S3JNF2_LINAN|nr:protein FAM81A [Lingula anatina]|eukprot:XP_013411484.1 protein FAM81A [Lingula anatina]
MQHQVKELPAIRGARSPDTRIQYRETDARSPHYRDQPQYGGYDLVDNRSASRVEHLEERLAHQERTTQALLEKAVRIKEDILDNTSYTHGTWQNEKRARELLQDHIRTITDVVKKLDWDIKIVEDQLRMKDSSTSQASAAVKNLEVHHVAGLTDLRGRVARCDASIAKLASDSKACFESIKSLNTEHQNLNTKLMEKLQDIENKMAEINNRLDKVNIEHTLKIKHMEGDSSQQLSHLDTKTRALFEELRHTLTASKAVEEAEREKMESRLFTHLDRSSTSRDGRLDKMEKKVDEWFHVVEKKLQKMEDEMIRDRERTIKTEQAFESRFSQHVDVSIRKQNEEISKVKKECREAFATLHESIVSMKSVQDGKRKLLEEQIRKEIGQIRKMVVLL